MAKGRSTRRAQRLLSFGALALLAALLPRFAIADDINARRQVIADEESAVDTRSRALQVSLAAFSTKTSDVMSFDVKGWEVNHRRVAYALFSENSRLSTVYLELLGDARQESTATKKCALYELARTGALMGHGLPYAKNAMQTLVTQTDTLRKGLTSVEHELETKLLQDQLQGGRQSGALRMKLQLLRDALDTLQRTRAQVDDDRNEFARWDSKTVEQQRTLGCPGYPKAPEPSPSPKPSVSVLPSPKPSPSVAPPAKPSPTPSPSPKPSPFGSCPPGTTFLLGYGCLYERTASPSPSPR